MLKRGLGILILILIMVLPTGVSALTLPVSRVSGQNAVILLDDTEARLISTEIDLFMEEDQTLVKQSLLLENTNKEEETRLLVAIPAKVDNNSIDIDQVTALVEGKQERIRNRRNNTKAEDSSIIDLPSNWHVLTLDLKPGQYKLVDFSYTIKNPMDQAGVQTLYLPLGYLKNWPGDIQLIKLNLYKPDMEPYGFEPNPNVTPSQYGTSSIGWTYNSKLEIPDYIRLYYRYIDRLATDYLVSQAPGDKNIKAIVNAFEIKAYDQCIDLIDSHLEAQSGMSLEKDLLFLKALAKQGLYQTEAAIDIFKSLENEPIYGDLRSSINSKMIYDNYLYLKASNAPEADLYNYLNGSKQAIVNNTIFTDWIEGELSQLSPPPSPEPTPVETSEPSDKDKDQKEDDQDLVKHITLFGKQIPVEILFIVGIGLLVLIPYLLGRRKRNKNKYLFR